MAGRSGSGAKGLVIAGFWRRAGIFIFPGFLFFWLD
jgi:hypothetical protein